MIRQQQRARQRELVRARASIVRALGPVVYIRAAELEMAAVVVSGFTSPETAAETLSAMNDLADATVRGDISETQGIEIVAQQALGQRGDRRAD